MNKKNQVIKLMLSFIMVIGMLGGIKITKNAMAATGLNMAGTTIKMYPYSNSNFALYDRTSGNKKKIGTCYGKSDQITIRAVGTDGWSTVTIPVTGTARTKTGYCLTSYLFQNINFGGATGIVQSAGITTYRKYDCKTTYGTAAKNDRVFILGYASENTQILYPCGSYYKAAWIKGRYVFSNGKLQKANSANAAVSIKQSTTIPDGYYRIRSSINNAQVFDIDRGSKADCANLQISQYNGGENQLFYLSKNRDGYYIIRVVHSNMVLDVYFNAKGNGANIVQSRYHGGANQQWKIYETSDGKYLFQSRSNGLFIDVSGGIAKSGQNIQCYSGNNTPAQKFSLQCVNYSNTGNTGSNNGTLGSPVPKGCKFSQKGNDNGWYGFHDINRGVSKSTPVYALTDGTVTYKQAYRVYSGVKKLTSYGNFIEFTSSNGIYKAKYCHLNQFVGNSTLYIQNNNTRQASGSTGIYNCGSKTVKKGEIIGYIGTTGNSSGIHLHFELRKNGSRIDPTSAISGLY